MTLLTPIWMQATSPDTAIQYPSQQLREVLRALIRSDGILNAVGGALQVTQRGAGANFSVDIAPGHFGCLGDDVADQGVYLACSTATFNQPTPTAPATGTRTHRVVAQIRDKFHNPGSWSTYDWTPVLLQDTGGGTPALPASAIPLARVSIAAGQSSVTNANITDDRIDAALLDGQPLQAASSTGRPPNPWPGQRIWRTDLLDFEVWNGTAWVLEGLNRPVAVLKRTTAQSISDSTITPIQWTSELSDSHGGHDNSTNNTRYTAPIAGTYLCSTSIGPVGTNALAKKWECYFRTNGSALWPGLAMDTGQNDMTQLNPTRLIPLNAGDYVEVVVWHNYGTGISTNTSYGNPQFDVCWMRP